MTQTQPGFEGKDLSHERCCLRWWLKVYVVGSRGRSKAAQQTIVCPGIFSPSLLSSFFSSSHVHCSMSQEAEWSPCKHSADRLSLVGSQSSWRVIVRSRGRLLLHLQISHGTLQRIWASVLKDSNFGMIRAWQFPHGTFRDCFDSVHSGLQERCD